MYQNIMVPVDLSHLDQMQKALSTAATLAKVSDGTVTFVSVTGVQPSAAAHSPEEFRSKLESFAADQASAQGIQTAAHPVIAHDPAVEIDKILLDTSIDLGADLIVAATHVPSFFGGHSHGGALARQALASVFLIRADAL